MIRASSWFGLALVLTVSVGLPCGAAEETGQVARQILSEASVKGGLVVQLGCGDGALTAALRASERYTVHALDPDPARVAAARAHVEAQGLAGAVTVERWEGERLPYIDNLVNLLVATGELRVSRDEMLRALAPRGVAMVRRDGEWARVVKPVPEAIDEWTHYLHDATNNAVAQDTAIGPPRRYQWIGAPRWLRHHDHMSGFSALVSARGRLFYIIDLGPRWSVQMPPRWTLVARDGFSGTVLWQRPIPKWHAHLWPLKHGPARLMRRLVAVGDTVYVTLGVGAPVTALDAATGQVLRTYAGTEGTEEILVADGVLFAVAHPEKDAYRELPRESVTALRRAGHRWHWDETPRRLLALRADSGRLLWRKRQRVAPVTLACAGGRVYLHDGERVLCLDAADGSRVWASEPIPRWKPMHVLFGPTLVVHGGVVLFAGGEKMDPRRGGKDTMTCLSAETGKALWTAPHPPSGYASAEDLFVIDGLAWCGETTNRGSSGVFTGRDLRTGEVKVRFPPDDWPHMPHHRCHRAKATVNYILTSRTGIEFVDFRARHWEAHHWVRGSCNYGILPANGLVYAPPHSCACYPVAKLHSFNALAPAGEGGAARDEAAAPRPERGPAYASSLDTRPSTLDTASWPTYRHDAARSGATPARVPTDLSRRWRTALGGRLSPPVIADGRVFVASIDTHTVQALDAGSGQRLWRFAAGGRVDSPPTAWQGRVLFGSADGFVYCLRAGDGALAWRFRAAPAARRMTAYGQVESPWPVHGSVLVRDGVVYCVAGRAMWLDGGLRLLRLDAKSGRKLSETVLDDKHPETGKSLQADVQWPNLPTALPDILSCDGESLYMRAQAFDLEGKRRDIFTPTRYNEQRGERAHLFSPTGFLDGSWWHRSYWLWGRSFIGGAGGWYLASYQAPAGRILAVDGSSVFGFGRAPLQFTGTPNTYHLFACAKEPERINPNPKRPPRRRGSRVYGKVYRTRLDYRWSKSLPFLVTALVATDRTLFAAGPPALVDERNVYIAYGDAEVQQRMAEQVAAFQGDKGAVILGAAKTDGRKQAAWRLATAPVFDGLAAAGGRLFLSGLDGAVLCLGAGEGEALTEAPDVAPGPPPSTGGGFIGSKSHADFQHLETIRVTSSELGYRMQTASGEVGLALRKLDQPIEGRAEFRAKVRPTPGARSPDTPGNGFIAFGPAPEDARLVKAGFRIAGQRLYVAEGPLLKSKAHGIPLQPKANETAELRVTVDLDAQKVTVSMLGKTAEAKLPQRLETIAWVGHCIHSVTTDFSRIDIQRP
ncbi:MAG: PQQ-binding-like beta-propeller repeat protein [Planctomycetota bacterium]